jgi:hypothetical protein
VQFLPALKDHVAKVLVLHVNNKLYPVEAMMAKNREEHFFERYQWWFVVIGLIGNGLFFVGSICFLSKSLETISISLFIAGSCFMLVSQSAAAIAEYSKQK